MIASERSATCSLAKTFDTTLRTVFGDRNNARAMSAFARPGGEQVEHLALRR